MNIRIISLRDAADHRASIARQLAAHAVDFEFFNAVTPRDARQHVSGCDESEYILNCGRPATDGEIACFASHLALWRQCVATSRPMLILEDDAQLTPSFPDGLEVIDRQVFRRGLVRVCLPLPRRSRAVEELSEFVIHCCMRVPQRSLGYAISPHAAARLIAGCRNIEEPVGKYLQRFWRHGQRIYALLPAIVEQPYLADNSHIGGREHEPRTLSVRMKRMLRKSSNSLARVRSNVIFSIEAHR